MVIFNRRTNKAHLLDARAAAIWRASSGETEAAALASLMGGANPEEASRLVQLAISDLERAGLLVADGDALRRADRRGLLRSLGTAAALPMVISILAPSAAVAASNVADCAVCPGGVTDTCATAGRTCTTGANGTRCCTAAATMDTLCDTDPGANASGNNCCSGASVMTGPGAFACVGN